MPTSNEPWTLVNSAELYLDPVWNYDQRNQDDANWQRCLSCLRIGLSWVVQCVADSNKTLLAWAPIPLRKLETCIDSQFIQHKQRLPWFSKVALTPPLDRSLLALVS